MSVRPGRLLITLLCTYLPSAAVSGGPGPWAEPLPWDSLDHDPGFRFEAQRFDDAASGWQADVLGLTSVVARGPRNRLYVRWRYLSLHTAGRPVFARWPGLAPDVDGGADPDWPGESAISGWGRPELGLLAPLGLPLLGESVFCGEAALPFARNDLYPYAARSASLRLALRRKIALSPGLALSLGVEQVMNMGAAGEDLSDEAFPSRGAWGGTLAWRLGGDRRLALDGRATDDGASRRLGLTLTWPLGEDRRLDIGLLHSLADEEDRLYGTRLSVGVTVGLADAERPRDEQDRAPEPSEGKTP